MMVRLLEGFRLSSMTVVSGLEVLRLYLISRFSFFSLFSTASSAVEFSSTLSGAGRSSSTAFCMVSTALVLVPGAAL